MPITPAPMPVAFVRPPSPSLADGIVTHIDRSQDVDADLAWHQWRRYVEALRGAGYRIVEVEPAPMSPDGVFVEDALLVFSGTAMGEVAVATRPAEGSRMREVAGARAAATAMGLQVLEIPGGDIGAPEPVTLDGGDVLAVGDLTYVGVGGRTTVAGACAFGGLLEPLGRRVVAVPISKTLHLKSQVTALPDGTVVGYEPLVDDPSFWPTFLAVPEPEGAHVVALGEHTVLMADVAPRTADLYRERGLTVISLPMSEFIKMEGCVTCLSVRLHPYD